MFTRVAIIGVGLIGGSLGGDLRRRKLARKVVGFGRTRKNLVVAKKRGLINEIALTLPQAIKGADLVILASPVGVIESHLRQVARLASPGAIVMDVGSTKERIVRQAGRIFPSSLSFIGAHPLAGTERGGASAAIKGLFKGRRCLITPSAGTNRGALKMVVRLWKKLGSEVLLIPPAKHDTLLALTSHLPHLTAFALMRAIGSRLPVGEIKKLAGGGLLDTTRIAASPSEMWRDIALANRKALLSSLKGLLREVQKLVCLIERKNRGALGRYFEQSSKLRRQL